MEMARWGKTPCALSFFPPTSYLDWLATNVCICTGQRSSEISCDKYTATTDERRFKHAELVSQARKVPALRVGDMIARTRCQWTSMDLDLI
jgi:hypothetical protein